PSSGWPTAPRHRRRPISLPAPPRGSTATATSLTRIVGWVEYRETHHNDRGRWVSLALDPSYRTRRTPMKPETVGMSPARLARLDDLMKRRYVESGYLPGLLTYIWRKGQLVHTSMCGHMDIERGRPTREEAIFRIYSMSKPI